MSISRIVGYQCFRRIICLHLQGGRGVSAQHRSLPVILNAIINYKNLKFHVRFVMEF